MYNLLILRLDDPRIQEFPSVHGHKCWSTPTRCPHISSRSGMQRRDWDSTGWPMSSQLLWVIVGDCYDHQQNVGRCSGPKQSPDT